MLPVRVDMSFLSKVSDDFMCSGRRAFSSWVNQGVFCIGWFASIASIFDFLKFSYFDDFFPLEEDVDFASENWFKEIIDEMNARGGPDPSCN